MKKPRIVVADDCAGARTSAVLVMKSFGYEVVGQACDGDEAFAVCLQQKPDVLLLDVSMPGMDGLCVLWLMRHRMPGLRVILVTGHVDGETVLAACNAKPDGIYLKTEDIAVYRKVVDAALEGGQLISPETLLVTRTSKVRFSTKSDCLTIAERSITALVANGKSNKQIADYWAGSTSTVKNHRTAIREKTAIHEVAEMTRLAMDCGLCVRRE